MKRLLTVLALIGFANGASASPDLARDWGLAASDLYVDTVHALEGGELPATYEDGLIRFSVTAARLSNWIEKTGGPSDLGCIFRGMSEEAETQLFGIASDTTKGAALRRLATLFFDAEKMALAAIQASATHDIHPRPQAPISCIGNPQSMAQYLTEQP